MRDKQQGYSRKEVLCLAREMQREYGEKFSLRRFRAVMGVPLERIRQLFGGWPGLLKAIGLKSHRVKKPTQPTDRELIEALRELAREQGIWITQEDFARHVGVSVSFLYRRFGSWQALREAAGLGRRSKPGKIYTNRELMDDMLRIYLKTGQVATRAVFMDCKGWTRFPANTLRNRFGGNWNSVMHAFGIYMQEYFLSHDPNWTKDKHEEMFKPDVFAKVEWPAKMDGLDWHPQQGFQKARGVRRRAETLHERTTR